MQRRFGPEQGAGVVVVETEGDKTIQPAPTGVVFYAGKTLKGRTDILNHCPDRDSFLKKVGAYVDGSQLPDAALDFWNFGQGAGEMFVQRITDGTEVEAAEKVFSRHTGHGLYIGALDSPAYDEQKRAVATITAKNGGRWGGRLRTMSGRVADEVADITATTITTGITMLTDEWAGATLRLQGVSTKTYTVLSNTSAGVVTVASDQNMENDLLIGGAPTNDAWSLSLDTEVLTFPTQIAGTRRAISYLLKDGQENETEYFGLEVYEDEVKVLDYPNLSMLSTNKWYAENVINKDTSNFWIDWTNLFSGTVTASIRPANWYGQALDWASDVVTVEIAHVTSITSAQTNVGWVDGFKIPSGFSEVDRVRRQQLVITFTSATAFTVTTTTTDGADLRSLGNGTVDTPFTPATGKRFTIGFTVHRGKNVWTTGDIIKIDVLPLPVDEDGNGLLVGGYLIPDVGSDIRKKVQIKANTVNTITLATAPSPVPSEAIAALPADFFATATLTFPFTLTTTTLELAHSFFGRESLTIAGGPHANATALAAAINTAWQSASGSSGSIATASGSTVRFHVDDSGADTEKGLNSFLRVLTTHAELGLTDTQQVSGTPGDTFRVQARTELRGGYDGTEPDAADFIAAAASAPDTLMARLFGQNKGLVKVATPGQTDTTIQGAWRELASAFGYQYRHEIPSATTDDSAAVAFVNDTLGRNDFGVVAFPSYGVVPNPQGGGTVTRTLTGAIHGREALVARAYEGYHKAAAGIDVTLPHIVELPTGDRVLNEEILNPAGIQVIKKIRGSYVIWGDRTIALDPTWKWKHQREQMSHYERQLLENFDFIIFAINDPSTQGVALTTLNAFFLPEWTKRALRGNTYKEAISIKIDGSNNTNLTRSQGDLNCEIKLRLADTVERFKILMGKAGIFEDLGA